jgi:GTP pyrophosphokinase
MNDLELAISEALEAHEGDTDKADATYIRHPLRLMQQMDTEQERIVAVLHDVVEDSEYEPSEIEEMFDEKIRNAVETLTKPDEVDYLDEYIPDIASNSLATKVKKADLRDNLDLTRLSEVNEKMCSNIQKYHQALRYLENKDSDSRP